MSPVRVHFVSLVGASRAGGGTRSPYIATDAVTTAYSGTAEHLHAPVIVRSSSMAKELVLKPSIAEPLARAAGADAGFVGIGSIRDRTDPGWTADVPCSKWTELVSARMVDDIAGRFFDHEGRLIGHQINHRVIGLTLDQFAGIPDPHGRSRRADDGRALADGHWRGLLNALITDAGTGEASCRHRQ